MAKDFPPHWFDIPAPRWIIAGNVIALVAFFAIMPQTIPDWMAVLIQVSRMIMSSLVVVLYGWAIIQFAHDKEPSPSHALVIGIFLAFLADVIGSALSIAWRVQGRPIEWTMMNFFILSSFVTSIAAIHHIAVPGAIDGRIPSRNIWAIVTALVVAAAVAGIIIGTQLRQFAAR